MLQVSVQVNDYEKIPHGILPGNKMMPFLMSLTIISIFIFTVRNSSWGNYCSRTHVLYCALFSRSCFFSLEIA